MHMEELVASDLVNSVKFGECWFHWREFTGSVDFLSLLKKVQGAQSLSLEEMVTLDADVASDPWGAEGLPYL